MTSKEVRGFVVSVETIISSLQLRKVFKIQKNNTSEIPPYANRATNSSCNLRVLTEAVQYTKVNVYLVMNFFVYFIDYAIIVVPLFSPLYASPPCTPPIPLFRSWVVHKSLSASPFPILFLTSPCLFCTCHVCFLFPVLHLLPSPSLLITLHVVCISVILFLF